MRTINYKILYASNNQRYTISTHICPTYINFLQIGQFLDLPVKVDFTGKLVKQLYRFLPVLTSKNLQP